MSTIHNQYNFHNLDKVFQFKNILPLRQLVVLCNKIIFLLLCYIFIYSSLDKFRWAMVQVLLIQVNRLYKYYRNICEILLLNMILALGKYYKIICHSVTTM